MLNTLLALLIMQVPSAQPASVATAPRSDAVVRLAGDAVRLGDGVVSSWVEVDDHGVPVAVGVTLPDAVIASTRPEGAMLSLDLPGVHGLPFRHVLFEWLPGGHPPASLYGHDHWDAHFYLITAAKRRTIVQGETSERPAAAFMPDGFVPVPGLGLYSFPEVGVPWVHEQARELHGHDFDQTLIYGSTGTRKIFVELMFTSAFLAARPALSAPVPQPASVAESGYYATRYVIRYEPDERAFRISLEGMVWRDAGGPG
jgi:hypothetical protein